MSKYRYTEIEQQINNVLLHQKRELEQINLPDAKAIDARISESEVLLKDLGYQLPQSKKIAENKKPMIKPVMVVPSWEHLCIEAEQAIGSNTALESIFSEEELRQNSAAIQQLNREYQVLHHLDKYDIAISAVAGLLGAAVDIFAVSMSKDTSGKVSAGTLSNFMRSKFEEWFPKEEMEKLANSKASKVPYDAQNNRNTKINVSGLSSHFHRFLSLGHDPLLGFIIGVIDILSGRMTTIDKTGRIVSQVMEKTENINVFQAIAKEFRHLKSDVATKKGLPVPFMALFNLLQFGSIEEEEKTIAAIVQGMYSKGYDFRHFCAMSIPMMLVEVIVRLGYTTKRIKEGHTIKDSIPVSLNREMHPKLATMLFIGHAAATAINAGRVYFASDPFEINYPQWLAFAKYSYSQLKWALIQKPELRDLYITGKLDEKLEDVILSTDQTFDEFARDYIVVME